jgi:hypothetical protein
MKAIFCDIDGVLNCSRTPNPRKLPYVMDPVLLGRIKGVLDRTGARVILSSTWRYDPAGIWSAKYWGLHFDGVVPDLPGLSRCEEIKAWLAENPDVTRYAVLDDEDDGLDDLPLFQPSGGHGLTDDICKGLESYLNGHSDADMRRNRIVRVWQNLRACLRSHDG